MKALKALLAFAMLALLLGGVPVLLLLWGDPLSLFRVSWTTALVRPDDGTILLGLLSAVGWLAWIVLAVTTVTELISTLTHQRIRLHLPGIRWLQPAVGALVTMALSPVLTSNADVHVPFTPPASQAPHVGGGSAEEVLRPLEENPPLSREHIVVAGDELWGLAERELGSGASWRAITAINPGMTPDTVLRPGQVIRLPAATAPPQTLDTRQVIVVRDDTLWDLAEEHLGDAYRWPEIFNANRDVVVDPDEIDIGWQLSMPPSTAEPEPPTTIPGPLAEERITAPAASPAPNTPLSVPSALPTPSAIPDPVISIDAPTEPSDSPGSPPGLGGTDLRGNNSTNTFEGIGPVGGVLAASLVAGVMARRQVQLLHRGLGERVPPMAPSLQRFFAGLIQRSDSTRIGPEELGGTRVVLGWDTEGDVVLDLEQARCTVVIGSDEHTTGMAAAILTSLLCADWSDAVEVIAVQPDHDWSAALDDPRLTSLTDTDEAITHLQKVCAQRRLQLGYNTLEDVRADPDRAEMWAPMVFVFSRSLSNKLVDDIRDSMSLGEVGISVVAVSQSVAEQAEGVSVLHILSDTNAILDGETAFQPQLLSQPARHGVMSLFTAALDVRTTPAPWWRDGDETSVTVSPDVAAGSSKDGAMSAWFSQHEHPTLFLLGPVELVGTSGERPNRAVGQCIEYCAWLLLHPGSAPTTMVRELLVAETTRRSNMSRLRTWLGNDTAGNPYLPDAYSGRISLAPAVTSDWERFQSLLAGGVNISSTPLLHEALSLLRGRPLEGVSFQWPWTSQWQSDMTSMITDAAVVLADRYLSEQDYPSALWAIGQGQLAIGDDEILAVRRIQVLAQTGKRSEVDDAVMELTRVARAANRELTPDSIRRIQHSLHLNLQHVRNS
ncbi:MAG: LysM peptidoglycan-binding domain-containing protein [Arachnia sp.]